MSKAYVTINCDGAAFNPYTDKQVTVFDPAPEVARILRRLADKLDEDPQLWRRVANDTNGNMVATLVIEED